MDASDVQKQILQRYGVRVEPAMGEYALKRLRAASGSAFAVMGGDARTGIPVRQKINPAELSPGAIQGSLFES